MSDKITPEQLRKEAVAVERMHGETLTVDWRTKQAAQLRAHADALEENARLKERVALDDTEREYRRQSLANEIRETLKVRGHFAAERPSDLIGCVARAIESERERAERAEAQLAQARAEIAALKERIKQIEREHKDAMRDVAAEASRAARFPDEPYGTY